MKCTSYTCDAIVVLWFAVSNLSDFISTSVFPISNRRGHWINNLCEKDCFLISFLRCSHHRSHHHQESHIFVIIVFFLWRISAEHFMGRFLSILVIIIICG
jgi:hypothetical protein